MKKLRLITLPPFSYESLFSQVQFIARRYTQENIKQCAICFAAKHLQKGDGLPVSS